MAAANFFLPRPLFAGSLRDLPAFALQNAQPIGVAPCNCSGGLYFFFT